MTSFTCMWPEGRSPSFGTLLGSYGQSFSDLQGVSENPNCWFDGFLIFDRHCNSHMSCKMLLAVPSSNSLSCSGLLLQVIRCSEHGFTYRSSSIWSCRASISCHRVWQKAWTQSRQSTCCRSFARTRAVRARSRASIGLPTSLLNSDTKVWFTCCPHSSCVNRTQGSPS